MTATRSQRPAHVVTLLLIGSLVACAPAAEPTASPTAPGSATATSGESVITIASPIDDARVTVPVTADGTANTAEGALTVELLTKDGDTLCARHIVATSGSGASGSATPGSATPGTWQTDLAFVPPDADQSAVLRAYELNPEDGTAINVVETPVVVTSERPPMIIKTPVCGATVAPGGVIAVTGRAQVSAAQFSLELRDTAGTAVLTQALTAENATEGADFSAMVTVPADLAGGFYDLVGYQAGAAGGSVKYEFPVQILVQ